MKFECSIRNTKEKWTGNITYLNKHETYYEINIQSRSGIVIIVGKHSYGRFVCIPDYNVGCHISYLKDRFYNTEKLSRVIGEVDGITIATALYKLGDTINL